MNEVEKKEIEEMAKAICSHCLEMTEEKVCPYANTEDEAGNEACFTERLHEAEKVYNAGYRKLPEDSVVLSREEQEYIQSITEKRIKELKKQITQERKETAEKILQPLYDACKDDSYGQVVVDFAILERLAKQFGVEIKE